MWMVLSVQFEVRVSMKINGLVGGVSYVFGGYD